MRKELELVHSELREAILCLSSLIEKDAPDEEALSVSRLRLAKLNRQRGALVNCSILAQLHNLPARQAHDVADLAVEGASIAIETSEHIARWTLNAVRADWPGYQRACGVKCRSLLHRMGREAAVLYPVLENTTGLRCGGR